MIQRTLWPLSLALYFLAVSEPFLIPTNLDSGSCPLGQFPCGNLSVCLPQPLHCNGNHDCENGADEENCVDNSGWPAVFDAIQRDRASRPKEETYECMLDLVPERCDCWQRTINCRGQDLGAVPAVSSNVTALLLQNNKIRNLSRHEFAGLHDLKRLFLSHNQITLVEAGVFKDLRQLEWLIIDNNRLSKIVPGSFMGLESLFLLVLLNNYIKDIPPQVICTDMPRLTWLDLEGNQMRMIRSSVFEQCITVLVLRRNKIKKIQPGSLSKMRNLVELDLSVNKLQELPPSLLKDLPVLQQLNISFNPLKEITKDHFDTLKHLHSLGLEGLEIPNIHNQMFTKLTNLSHIYFKKFQYCSYAPHVRACKPNTDGISSFEDLLANILLRVFVWVMACVTCFGNLFVICMRSFIVTENCQHTMSIKSLCCADCLMGIYLFSIGAFDLKFQGEYNKHAHAWKESSECKLVGSLAMLSSEVSVMLLTYMTLEKYLCIVFPFSHFRAGRKQTLSTLVAIWILGLLITVIPFWNESAFGNFYGRNGVCFPLQSDEEEKPGARDYSASIFLGLNLIAFVTIVFCYTSMFYSIHRTGAKAAERSVLSREVAIAKRFFFIVITDALCWIPIFLLKAVSLTKVEIPITITSWVVIFILPINSALNPILYTVTTASFQERLKQCLKIKQRQLQESFTLVSTQSTNAA